MHGSLEGIHLSCIRHGEGSARPIVVIQDQDRDSREMSLTFGMGLRLV
jgi:hypothetical protein